MDHTSAGKQAATGEAADALIDRIVEGRWKKSLPLPDIGHLAQELRTEPETITSALDLLHSERLIARRRDGQYTVTDLQVQALTVRFSNLFGPDGERVAGEVGEAAMERAEATSIEADRLRVAKGSPVCRVRRIRHHRGRRFMVEMASLPLERFPGLMDSGRVPFRTPVLCKRYGLSVRNAEEHVSLGTASADVAVALGVGYGTPLFVLDRVLRVADGTPVEYRLGHTLMTDLKYVAIWGTGQSAQ